MIFFRKKKRTEVSWREDPNPQRWGVDDVVDAADGTSVPTEDIENEELKASQPEGFDAIAEAPGPVEDIEPIEDIGDEVREASPREALEPAETGAGDLIAPAEPVGEAPSEYEAAETPQEPVAEEEDAPVREPRAPIRRPHVIVVANEKGGCGKSTLAMHIALYLMDRGKSVGTIDLDGRQGTLTRMFNNRRRYAVLNGVDLPVPEHLCMCPPEEEPSAEQAREDLAVLQGDLQKLACQDFIVIDTPGTDAYLSRFAHSVATTLITPVNDSFIDLDVLGHIEPDTGRVDGPSPYAEMVLEEIQRRQQEVDRPLDWIVTRNRLSNLYAHNKKEVSDALDKLSAYLGFRQAPGFSERVIFRELFPQGLTLLDLRRQDLGFNWTLSHIGAREELRQLIAATALGELVEDGREREPAGRPLAAETVEDVADEPLTHTAGRIAGSSVSAA